MRTRGRRRAMAVVVATSLLLAACSDDGGGSDGSDDAGERSTTTAAPTTTTEPEPPSGEARAVAIALTDTALEIPARVPAGPTRFVVTNRGKQPRGVVLVELDGGTTVDELADAVADDPAEALAEAGLVPGPHNVAPGATQATRVDLEAGSYAALAIGAGIDAWPLDPVVVRPVTVVADDASEGSALPSGPTIEVGDDAIATPGGVEASTLVRVENTGDEPHDLALYRVADGSTYVEAVAYLTESPRAGGAPLATPAGGLGPLSPGAEAAIELDELPGIFVLMCSMPDADGEPHLLTEILILP